MIDRRAEKAAARIAAATERSAAHAAAPGAPRRAAAHVLEIVAGLRGVAVVSGYLPIRHELDPLPAMRALVGLGLRVAVPVIVARGAPLAFHAWSPGVETVRGGFGVEVPVTGEVLEPDLLIVPLLAFDGRGHRLGYGGGYYDRTIAGLRGRRAVTAVGFAFAAQQLPEVPDSAHDMRLDAVVTERGVLRTG